MKITRKDTDTDAERGTRSAGRGNGLFSLIFRSLIVVGLFAGAGRGQDIPAPSAASLEFLRFGVGGRPAALGSAYVGLANDLFGIFYNPAGIAHMSTGQIATSYNRFFLDINHLGLGLAIPSGFGSFGVALNGLFITDIEGRDSLGNPTGDYSAQFINPAVAYARAFGPFGLGVNVKTVLGFIDKTQTATVLVDLGTKLTFSHLGFGLVLENFGPEVRYVTTGSNPPMTVKAGAAVTVSRCAFALDIHKPLESGFSLRTGIEYSVVKNLALRLGYRTDLGATGALGGLSAGLGINAANLYLDYALVPYGDFGLAHTIALSYRFGFKEKKTDERVAEALKTKEQMVSSSLLNQGITFYNQGRNQEALNTWDLALIWNPDNVDAQTWIDRTKKEEQERTRFDLLAQGKKYLEAKDYPGAIENFDRVIALAPADSEALRLKDQATASYARLLLGTDPKVKEYLEKGLAEFSRGRYPAAIDDWRKVLEVAPDNPEALANINRAQLKIADEVADGLTRVGAFEKNDQWIKAIQECNRLLTLAPENRMLLDKKFSLQKKTQDLTNSSLQTGEAKFKAGAYGDAERTFRTALAYDPQNLTALRYLDNIAAINKQKKITEDPYALYLKGVEAYTKEDYSAAIAYWEKVLKIEPGNDRARKNIGRARQKLNVGK